MYEAVFSVDEADGADRDLRDTRAPFGSRTCAEYVHCSTLTDIDINLQTKIVRVRPPPDETMSNYRSQRRRSALFRVFPTVVATVAVVLLGGDPLATPVSTVQILVFALAGGCDLVAATDSFGGRAWYRWSGLGGVLPGASLPPGFVGTVCDPTFVLVTGLGGVSLPAIGIDTPAFRGTYTGQTSLDQHDL